MRELLSALAVVGWAGLLPSSAFTQPNVAGKTPAGVPAKFQPNTNLISSRPDLEPVFVGKAGDIVVIEVINRGLELNNKQTVARVRMYQTVNGQEFLVTGTYASIPLVPSGQLRRTSIRFPQAVENCRLQIELDFNQQLPEANENNNVKSWKFK